MLDSTADVAGSGAGTLEGVHRPKRRALGANAVPPPAAGAPAAVPASQSRSAQTQGQGKGPTSAGAKPISRSAAAASKPSSSSNNKLDTDENFLKAVNSMKRGKKNEDNFDREFNQLRITKPRNVNVDTISPGTNVKEAVVAPWDTIDDFGDVGIRGNFMVVVEMDIQRGASAKYAPPARDDDLAHPEWIGKPNFKKFKTVSVFFYSFPLPLGMLTSDWTTEKHSAYRAQADSRARYQRGERLWYRKWYCNPFFPAHIRLTVTQLLFL